MMQRRIADYRKKYLMERSTLKNSYLATINALAYAIEARDPYTRGHSERVSTYALWIGEALGMPARKLRLIQQCCRLHDVGKIGIPDSILLKPGKISLEERAQIELHPVYGVEILGDLGFMRQGLPMILGHHERYDGRGYPYGLKKEQIALEVRIITVADSFDAMTSDRPYRKAMTIEEAKAEFQRHSGTQFDPRIVRVLMRLISAVNPRAVPRHLRAA